MRRERDSGQNGLVRVETAQVTDLRGSASWRCEESVLRRRVPGVRAKLPWNCTGRGRGNGITPHQRRRDFRFSAGFRKSLEATYEG
jgi:hypothetical protein